MNIDSGTPLHGGQLRRIAELFDIPVPGLLDFSANINPEGPSPVVLAALREALKDPAILSQYPDLEETQLRRSISAYAGVALDEIAVANGFVPLLDATLKVLPIRNCLVPVPAFCEYRRALERNGVTVTPFVLDQAADFRYQPDELIAALRGGGHDSILLANPQNPTGVLCDRAALTEFMEEVVKLNVTVLLDEAFIDYVSEHSMVKDVTRFPNLIIFRSVTKFHGIPGLRVAYAVAQDATILKIHQNLAPWSITTLSAIAVRAALADAAYRERTLRLNKVRKENLIAQFKALGFSTYPGAANFLLIYFQSFTEAKHFWQRLILDHGIVLRHCTNFEGISHNHLRCAVLGDEENSRLLKALARIRLPQAWASRNLRLK
jgi:threonine-phosphate decarboxylase